jgi:hypothetical protein
MRTLIRRFDHFLRRKQGVFEFWDDPECLFRIGIAQAPHTIHLPDSAIPAGAKVVGLHLWNEHMPHFAPQGPDLAMALRVRRMLRVSFQALAREIQRNPLLTSAQAVGGATVLIDADASPASATFFTHFGFTIYPYYSPLGRFGEFWENFYTWALMWTFNEASLRQRSLQRLRRHEIWMSTIELVRRYGAGENA